MQLRLKDPVRNDKLSTPNKENVAGIKRLLNTPQGNSLCRKAVCVNSPTSKLSSRKSLSFARRENTDEERLDAALYAENLPDEGDLHGKVLFVANGELIARIPRDMPSKLLVKQLALPELSRTMAYRTRKTVNRLERKQLHLDHVVPERPQEE